jgi:hypothetical protein
MTPKDWNTQEEAIAAAKAEILAAIGDTDARLELGMVKSVQRGDFISRVLTAGNLYADIYISNVNPEKCIVLLNSAEYIGSSSTNNNIGAYLMELGEERIRVGFTGNNIKISWQVIEFY